MAPVNSAERVAADFSPRERLQTRHNQRLDGERCRFGDRTELSAYSTPSRSLLQGVFLSPGFNRVPSCNAWHRFVTAGGSPTQALADDFEPCAEGLPRNTTQRGIYAVSQCVEISG